MFADYAMIHIKSGKGGDGHVSFRRELYVPAGGPDGGDGGKGGDVIFVVDKGLNTLTDYRHKRKYYATDGEQGGKKRCHGANGRDAILKVPEGTVIRDAETGLVIADMSGIEKFTVLKGGRGGKGNMNYATATMQAPKYAQPGQPALELDVILELKTIADVGLVGYPNVGKSTFLSRVTNARPKIANYHFTTLNPNLGVVDLDDADGFVIADIPGLIEGASEGLGLGHQFLRHIERTRVIIHIVDASGSEGRDPVVDIENINRELSNYSHILAELPQIIAANKIDIMPEDDAKFVIDEIKEKFEPLGYKVLPISCATGQGIKELLYTSKNMLNEIGKSPVVYDREFVPGLREDEEPISVFFKDDKYHIEGPKVDRMLGYTNLESEKGFDFFQKFMKDNGVLDKLEELGISEGDTVCVYDLEFDYYK